MEIKTEDYLTPKNYASHVGVSDRLIRSKVKRGVIPVLLIDGVKFIHKDIRHTPKNGRPWKNGKN